MNLIFRPPLWIFKVPLTFRGKAKHSIAFYREPADKKLTICYYYLTAVGAHLAALFTSVAVPKMTYYYKWKNHVSQKILQPFILNDASDRDIV